MRSGRLVLHVLSVALVLVPVTLADGSASTVQTFDGYLRCSIADNRGPEKGCVSGYERRTLFPYETSSEWTALYVLVQSKGRADALQLQITTPTRDGAVRSVGTGMVGVNLTGTGTAESLLLNVTLADGGGARADYLLNFTVRVLESRDTLDPQAGEAPHGSPRLRVLRAGPDALPKIVDSGDQDALAVLVLSPIAVLAALWILLRSSAVNAFASAWWFFARKPPERLLEHPRRQLMMELVERHPGIREAELQRMADLSNGAFLFHLRLLVQNGFLRKERVGNNQVLFTAGQSRALTPLDLAARIQQGIVAHPGIRQSELARLLGLPSKTLHYHVTNLRRAGKIRLVPDGRATLCYWNA